MRVLYVTTVAATMNFFPEHVRMLIDSGVQVDIATNTIVSSLNPLYEAWGCKVYNICFSRSPFSQDNIEAYRQLQKLVTTAQYDVVHTHTPVASFCARLACRNIRKNGTKVLYTVHGFHFYKGAPLKNWLIYYPVEKLCAHWTDVLITINREDYERAKHYMAAKRVEYVPGVGLDVDRIAKVVTDRVTKRKKMGIGENAFLLLSVGELNENKNQSVIIQALAELKDQNIHFAVAGEGSKRDELLKQANKLGVAGQVHLLGFRSDVNELYKCADVFTFSSYREGLPVSVMEAMASGLPIISSRNRGCRDELVEGKSGYMLDPDDAHGFAMKIRELMNQPDNRRSIGAFNREHVLGYSTKKVLTAMHKIYGLSE